MVRYNSSEEALPLWKTSSLPRSAPKRPVGRPRKRKLDSLDVNESSKCLCSDNQPDTVNTGINDTEVESASVMPLNVDHNVSAKNVCPVESDTNINSASEQVEIQRDSSSDQIPSDNLHLSASNFRGNYKHFSVKQKMEVVEFSKLHGIRTAAKHFKIPKSSVSRCCKTDFTSCVRDKKGILPKLGRPLTYPEELDQKILEYIQEQCDLQNAVSIVYIVRNLFNPCHPGSRQAGAGPYHL